MKQNYDTFVVNFNRILTQQKSVLFVHIEINNNNAITILCHIHYVCSKNGIFKTNG